MNDELIKVCALAACNPARASAPVAPVGGRRRANPGSRTSSRETSCSA